MAWGMGRFMGRCGLHRKPGPDVDGRAVVVSSFTFANDAHEGGARVHYVNWWSCS